MKKSKSNFMEKVKKVRSLLDEHNLAGILLTEQKNVSWLTGARLYVNLATEKSIAPILVTRTSTILIASNIEAGRLINEEIGNLFDEQFVFQWYEPLSYFEIVEKFNYLGKIQIDSEYEKELKNLRTILTSDDVMHYKELGQDAVEVIETTAFEIEIGETEQQIAARLSAKCHQYGIEPVVNLVAVDDRVFTRRHPLPTDRKLEKYAMLVVSGRRNGQMISVTRLVHFGSLQAELAKKHRAVVSIDAQLIANTKKGTSFQKLFELVQAAYQEEGFIDEWKNHHQGGLSGYVGREQLIMPNVERTVQANQVFAWNPSIAGVKSEDTILVEENGTVNLTATKYFPIIAVKVNGTFIERLGILIR